MLLSAFALSIAGGCSKTASYHGQVFVDNAGTTMRISDTEVRVVPAASLLAHESQFKENIDKLVVRLRARQEVLRKFVPEVETMKIAINSLCDNERVLIPIEPSALESAKATLAEIDQILAFKIGILENSFASLTQALEPSIYFIVSYSGEKAKVSTDADGRFAFKIDRSDDEVVIANKNAYYWYVTLSKKSDEPIYLSSSNLHETGCSSCYFATEASRALVSRLATHAAAQVRQLQITANDVAAADKSDTLLLDAQAISAKHKRILSVIGKLPVDKAYSDLLGQNTIGGVEEHYRIERAEIQLKIDVLQARDKHLAVTKALINRAADLKKLLIAI